MEKNSLGAKRPGGRVVTMTAILGLDRLPAQSIWEMSAKRLFAIWRINGIQILT